MELLSIETVTGSDGVVRLVLVGEIDLSVCDRLRSALDAALAGQPRRVSVDMTGVRFLDSSGISLLVRTCLRAEDAGTALRLTGVTDAVARILRLTGVQDVLVGDGPAVG